MYNLEKDVVIGVVTLVALFGFISGEFIVSTVLFGAATVLSNITTPKNDLQVNRLR